MRAKMVGLAVLMVTGCSGDDSAHVTSTGQGGGGGSTAQGASGTAALAGIGAGGSAGSGSEGGNTGEAMPRVELPAGSRERDGIVNLVDAEAAQELDAFLSSGMTGLTSSLNLFLTYYEEDYDFVFLFTDHDLAEGSASGRFLSINSQPRAGTGANSQYLAAGYRTIGRIKGTMAVKYGAGPFSHEIMHFWGVSLDRSFGFGVGKTYNSPAHWGYAGVHGILGGFDPATLSCESPAGAAPPDCEADAEGRYRYVVGSFNAGGNDLPLAPLELYLMGLASITEVPQEIPVLLDAQDVQGTFDAATRTEIVDAAGLSIVPMSDIMARHGVVTELPENERHFSSAFVVVSASPASDEVLAEVAQRAAAFGGRGTHPITESFASDTGNRATMNTELGPRRAASNSAPEPRQPFECDVLEQDCVGGLSCHSTYCAIPGDVAVNGTCAGNSDCVAGAGCLFLGDPPVGQCAQYCDRESPDSPLACASLCTSTVTLLGDDGEPLATVCRPE